MLLKHRYPVFPDAIKMTANRRTVVYRPISDLFVMRPSATPFAPHPEEHGVPLPADACGKRVTSRILTHAAVLP